ncbi:MAG: BON domain-containing protein [Proteobacteria bacterium]|nr:BON domain-containing protein [Pseudomonadota bacterium]
MFNYVKKSDFDLQRDVSCELKWDAGITSTQINVSAKDGVVTLRGTVPHYSEKVIAEKAAQRVGGTRVVADELDVNLISDFGRSDDDIGAAAVSALEWNYQVPDTVKVSVEKGWVTLRGEVEWDYQRNAARDAVYILMGVNGVSNDITIKSSAKSVDIKTRIEEALKRSAESEGRNIKVEVNGTTVTLSGDVHSLTEIEDARIAAYNAPGVYWVTNNLKLAA